MQCYNSSSTLLLGVRSWTMRIHSLNLRDPTQQNSVDGCIIITHLRITKQKYGP